MCEFCSGQTGKDIATICSFKLFILRPPPRSLLVTTRITPKIDEKNVVSSFSIPVKYDAREGGSRKVDVGLP